MGPSGSGKSTFIRTFNGLEPYQGAASMTAQKSPTISRV
ncbi:hypothetical protein NC974_21175 [Leptolyngbya sp. SLC-A1]|nr:hypothetical protein [Leptolyngbya sp. FACHB-60]